MEPPRKTIGLADGEGEVLSTPEAAIASDAGEGPSTDLLVGEVGDLGLSAALTVTESVWHRLLCPGGRRLCSRRR